MAIKLRVQSTEVKLKTAGSDAAKLKASDGIAIYPHPYEGSYTVTPSEEEQTLETEGLMMTGDVTVAAAPLQSKEVTSSATAQEVEADEGYYGLDKVTVNAMASATPKTISESTRPNTPTVDANGLVTATTTTITGTMKPIQTAGYVDTDFSVPYTNTGGSATLQLDTQAAKTVTPTESEQTAVASGKYTTGVVKVGAISSTYVGSDIPVNPTPTASGKTVTIPTGYYSAQTTKDVATGTEGTPTATKGTVSSHSVTVTPSVTNTAGYITGGTKTGTGVSVSASELVSGTLNITSSGTKDVTNYANASVSAGTEGTPTATKGTVSNHSVSVTPSVTNTAGYISGSTKTGTAVTVSASELESGTKEITANGTNIDVTGYAAVDVSVPTPVPTLETVTKSYTPTTSQQTETITPSTGYDGIGEVDVTVGAMPTMTLPSGTSNSSSGTVKAYISANTGLSDEYLNIPTGYNGTAQYYVVKPVGRGSVIPSASMAGNNSTISYDQSTVSGDTIILTNSAVYNRPIVETAGYVSNGTLGTSTVVLTAPLNVVTTSGELTVSGKTVTVPTGYYPFTLTKNVADGTAGTPTATKGTVSNHSISVTPSVTNTTGYITGSTKTGTAVTVSASELVSGDKSITANGTNIDVANYSTVSVNVSGGTSNWTLIGVGTLTVNTTSTSAASAGTISCGSAAWTATDIIWVRIRGQSGKRDGYFYGSDSIFANYRAKNSSTTSDSVPAVQYYRVGTDGLYVAATGSYGVYAYSLATDGTLTVRRRYNSTNTLTINDKFDVEVYKLTLPTGKSLFT